MHATGFRPVVIDLRPSVKATIPSGKPVQCPIFTRISGHRKPRSIDFRARAQSEGRCSCKKEAGKDEASSLCYVYILCYRSHKHSKSIERNSAASVRKPMVVRILQHGR